ncbi:hypothetical protein HDU99_006889, partial [Rhizoclosmatium hyalinum]
MDLKDVPQVPAVSGDSHHSNSQLFSPEEPVVITDARDAVKQLLKMKTYGFQNRNKYKQFKTKGSDDELPPSNESGNGAVD